MPKREAIRSSRSRTQSWADNIPLGSLDQLLDVLQNPTHPGVPQDQSSLDPQRPNAHLISLPESPGASTLGGRSQIASLGSHPTAGSRSDSVDELAFHTADAGSLWQLEQAGTPIELRAPIPESLAASDESEAPPQIAPESIPGDSIFSEPASNHGTISGAPNDTDKPSKNRPIQHTSARLDLDYWQRIAPLAECLPHLNHIAPENGRHRDVGSITCVDYYCGSNALYYRDTGNPYVHQRLTITGLRNKKELQDKLRRLSAVTDDGPTVGVRLVMVEDLCPDLIETLGAAFEIDPEFFAEHLNRSGYDDMDYDDDPPGHWETNGLMKPYCTFKWYRPVLQNPKVTKWRETPGSLLGKVDANIIQLGASGQDGRASITWYDSPLRSDGSRNEDRKEHRAVVSTNIFRRSRTLSARPARLVPLIKEPSDGDKEHVNFRASTPTAWEEKATCFVYHGASAPIVILLLDPLPGIHDHQRLVGRAKASNARIRARLASFDPPIPIDMAIPLVPRAPPDLPLNKFEANDDEIRRFQSSIGTLRSSTRRICKESKYVQPMDWHGFRADPIVALLRVVQSDLEAFFFALESALDEISQDSLDDYLMTKRLAEWRMLMNDFEIEVPAIARSLTSFVEYIFGHAWGDMPEDLQTVVSSVNEGIERSKRRLDSAYTALRADMQFTESRRSINEAKTVSKLTELAFIFIPLSFTCSLFSMSIRELQNGVPVWTFIVTALAMGLLSYAIRLVIASEFIAESTRGALERFWARRDVRRGADAPVLTLVLLTLQEVWRNGGAGLVAGFSVVIAMSAFVVIPIAFLWTSTRLDVSFNIAMTLLFVIAGLAFAWFLKGLHSDPSDGVTTWFNRVPEIDPDNASGDV